MHNPTATLAFPATLDSKSGTTAAPSIGARLLGFVAARRGDGGDAREAYLAGSVDHRDLESRARAWDAHVERMKSLTFAG